MAMKKLYSVNLDQEPTEIVQKFLKSSGQTFSGFLNGLVNEFAKEIQGQPGLHGKRVGQMSMRDFIKVLSFWFKRADAE